MKRVRHSTNAESQTWKGDRITFTVTMAPGEEFTADFIQVIVRDLERVARMLKGGDGGKDARWQVTVNDGSQIAYSHAANL